MQCAVYISIYRSQSPPTKSQKTHYSPPASSHIENNSTIVVSVMLWYRVISNSDISRVLDYISVWFIQLASPISQQYNRSNQIPYQRIVFKCDGISCISTSNDPVFPSSRYNENDKYEHMYVCHSAPTGLLYNGPWMKRHWVWKLGIADNNISNNSYWVYLFIFYWYFAFQIAKCGWHFRIHFVK